MPDSCQKCRGTGYEVRVDDAGVAHSVPCECRQASRGDALLETARIPRRYDHCSFESFEFQDPSLERAHRLAREWVEAWPGVEHGLLFHGPPGTGKTHLAVAVGRALMRDRGVRVLFYEQRELLKALQVTFDAGSTQREVEVLRPVQTAEVLILDDLGAGRVTEWNRDVMHDVIAYRYNEVLPLILTSNRAPGQESDRSGAGRRTAGVDEPLTLKDRLGDALLSRLFEMCEIVPMRGKDYRIGVRQHSRFG